MYDFDERSCHMRSQKGFSGLELILTLLVVTVLVAVFLPRGVRYARAGSEEVCALNRSTVLRLYKAHVLTHPGCALSDVLDGTCTDFEEDISAYRCHAGGLYAADGNTRIYCSKHGYPEGE